MAVKVKHPSGSLQRLCTLQADRVGTLRALRADVAGALPGRLTGRPFVLLDETLEDIGGGASREASTRLNEVYRADSVLIRWDAGTGELS